MSEKARQDLLEIRQETHEKINKNRKEKVFKEKNILVKVFVCLSFKISLRFSMGSAELKYVIIKIRRDLLLVK